MDGILNIYIYTHKKDSSRVTNVAYTMCHIMPYMACLGVVRRLLLCSTFQYVRDAIKKRPSFRMTGAMQPTHGSPLNVMFGLFGMCHNVRPCSTLPTISFFRFLYAPVPGSSARAPDNIGTVWYSHIIISYPFQYRVMSHFLGYERSRV